MASPMTLEHSIFSQPLRTAIACALATTCLVHGREAPRVFESQEAAKKLASGPPFSCSGLSFYHSYLYVGLAAGLLEIEAGSIKKLYAWDEAYSGVGGVWMDSAHGLLWVELGDPNRLAYYDGKTWRTVRFPKPRRGYVTRWDALQGWRAASNSRTFWLERAGRAWAWKGPGSSNWSEEALPAVFEPERLSGSLLKILAPTDEEIYFIRREGEHWRDSVYSRSGDQWTVVTNQAGDFCSEEAVGANKRAYVRCKSGSLIELAPTRVSRLTAPGLCEAITPSGSGALLASFRGLGVFELQDTWRKVLEPPFLAQEEPHAVHLTAQNESIALAARPLDETQRRPVEGDRGSRSGLWISTGKEWRQIAISTPK